MCWQGTPLILPKAGNRVILGASSMSLAIVLMGWVAASLLLTPIMGRFMAVQDEGEGRTGPRQIPAGKAASVRLLSGAHVSVRRNAAIQMPRRDVGWPHIG